jgi:16S rRNA (uracil1498-N3)-methyltransferase
MKPRRLFVPAGSLGGPRLTVSGSEHRHLARVLRARAGDAVTLFDGAGTEVEAEVARVGGAETELVLGRRRAGIAVDPALAVTLLVAIPRGERMDLLVQKTTELGVARLVPVTAGRSVARPGPEAARRARWERIAREAARQSGRADVPAVDEPRPLGDALGDRALPARRLALWEGARGRPLQAALAEGPPAATALLVGPEGGFAAEEVTAAEAAGWAPVGLGPRILRVETAAIVAVALAQAAAGALQS